MLLLISLPQTAVTIHDSYGVGYIVQGQLEECPVPATEIITNVSRNETWKYIPV